MAEKIPHVEDLREEIRGAGEHAKRMIDHVIRAACLWLEDHQAEASGRIERAPGPAQGDDPLMTAVEVGAYLKMAPATVRDWARKGRIPFELVGRERRFRRSVIDKWIEANKAKQSSPTHDNSVESGRSFLRPANQRSKSNGRV
jgi:excisionase family DNA binding protein